MQILKNYRKSWEFCKNLKDHPKNFENLGYWWNVSHLAHFSKHFVESLEDLRQNLSKHLKILEILVNILNIVVKI